MNNVCLMGRLTSKPDVRDTKNSVIASFTLAVDRRFAREGEQTADFIRCVCFGKTAEFAEQYLEKGTKIAVTGRIQTGSYENQDGERRYTTDIILDSIEFAESKRRDPEPEEEPEEKRSGRRSSRR